MLRQQASSLRGRDQMLPGRTKVVGEAVDVASIDFAFEVLQARLSERLVTIPVGSEGHASTLAICRQASGMTIVVSDFRFVIPPLRTD
ncbi:hypothetical protein XH97_34310 [Bradyrhizobium sp. CCBAU 53380]|nr:hypothetical protein [Bradyrhizobium sp. CCBAU 53380]